LTKSGKAVPEWLQAYQSQEKRVSCLFGEHLLPKYPKNAVALVEAPKTAIYSTLYFGFPDNEQNPIWLAVYNKSSFTFDKLKALQGRTVFVFPDLSKEGSTFSEWQAKAKASEGQLTGTRFVVSDLLEQIAPQRDRENGNDIADYLIQLDWRHFRKEETRPQPTQYEVESQISFERIAPKPTEDWSNDISDMEKFFTTIQTPTFPIKLNHYTTITNIPLFLDSSLTIVKANNGNRTYLPYLNRLRELKTLLTTI
jgi:hypothetical protein